MAFSHLKVIGVMGRRDLNHAGSEFPVHISISDNGNDPVHNGQHHAFPDEMAVPLILRVNGHSRIPQHGLRTGGGKGEKLRGTGSTVLIHHRIFDMPQMPRLLLIFHFRVGNGCIAHRTPVDHAGSLVDIAFLVHLHKHIRHGPVAALIHGKSFPVPVAGGTQLLQLGNNAPAVFFFPVPGPFQKLLPSQFMLVYALGFQGLRDLHLSGNGGVIRARLPQGVKSLHPLKTDNNILHGIVQGMAHVQLPCNIWGRNHNGERCSVMVHLCMKIFFLQPLLIQSVLQPLGVVGLCQFSAHTFSSLSVCRRQHISFAGAVQSGRGTLFSSACRAPRATSYGIFLCPGLRIKTPFAEYSGKGRHQRGTTFVHGRMHPHPAHLKRLP